MQIPELKFVECEVIKKFNELGKSSWIFINLASILTANVDLNVLKSPLKSFV